MSKQKYPTTVTTSTSTGDSSKGASKRKVNGYHSEKLHANWDKKRQEAKSRQRHYDGLTVKQRIALAQSRRGNSKRELGHLYNLLDVKPKQVEVSPVVAVTEKKTRKSDIVKAAKAQRPSKS